MSKSGFYRMPEEVRDKLVTVPRSANAAHQASGRAAFDKAHAKPDSTEQRLLAKLKAKRVAKAKKAAAASLASPRHIASKQKQRTR
jgi:hypothetical protein